MLHLRRLMKLTLALCAIAVVTLVPVALFAMSVASLQVVDPGTTPAVATLPDLKAPFATWITAGFTTLVVPLLVWLLHKPTLNKIPRMSYPVIVMALQFGGDYLNGLTTHGSLAWYLVLLLGLVSIGVREIASTISEHGIGTGTTA